MAPSTDRAVHITGSGGPEVLHVAAWQAPEPGPGEVRVAVVAAGLNRADVLQRRGLYPAPPGVPADIPGLEFSGRVDSVGPDVDGWSTGDRVMGLVGGGAMATRVLTRADELIRVPAALDLTAAAAVPEAFLTVYDALVLQAELDTGHRVLLHAVGSGIGTAAVQLCRCRGAITLGTSRSEDKLARCARLGLDHPLLVTDGSFAKRVRAATDGHGADVILDTVGAAYLSENLAALARRGTLIALGLLGGASGTLPLAVLLSKRARILGTVLRGRDATERARLVSSFVDEALPLLANERLVPVIDDVLPMSEIAAAHRRLEDNTTFGKLVLTWQD